MPISLVKLIEQGHRLGLEIAAFESEIAKRRKEKATIDRVIEKEALRLTKVAESEKSTGAEQIDCSMFKETTKLLLAEFQKAPDKILSHEDIRHDVIFDEYASAGAVWMVIRRARQEIAALGKFSYEIKSLAKKRYQLVEVKTLTNPHKTIKTRKKRCEGL